MTKDELQQLKSLKGKYVECILYRGGALNISFIGTLTYDTQSLILVAGPSWITWPLDELTIKRVVLYNQPHFISSGNLELEVKNVQAKEEQISP